jgi:hypothetical protein
MAKDIIHDIVKRALLKEGWTITDDPYIIEYKEITLYADLGAERPLAAERGDQKIVVEVKSFIGRSAMQDLKVAVGQYVVYFSLLEVVEPERQLYLAVSEQIYRELFLLEAVQIIVRRYQLALLVVNIQQEEVSGWIN